MAKKLLERLGLKRKKQAPVVVQNPIHGQPLPGQNQNQPQQQQQPPPQQPPPQQPPQQQAPQQQVPWQAPQRQQQPQDQPQPRQPRGNLGEARVKDAQRRAFEKNRSDAMPEVQRAKQLALTVDGQRIASQKSDSDSELAKQLKALSDMMQVGVKSLDKHGSIVRQMAEAEDFTGASDEIDKALVLAQQMLAEEDGYYKLLTQGQVEQPLHLSGDFQATDEFREARDEGEKLWPLIEEAQNVVSDNPAVQREQERVNGSYATYEQKMEKQDYAAALDAVRESAEAARVVVSLAAAAASYDARRREAEPVVLAVGALDPQGPNAQERQQVLDDFKASKELADKGKFGEADALLVKATKGAKKAFPDEALLAKTHKDSLANIMPVVERALAVETLCQPISEQQLKLAEVKGKIEKAGQAHHYDDARALMEVAAQYANTILRLAAGWDEYAAAEEQAQVTIGSALKLKPTKSDQLKQQKSVKANQEAAARLAMEGKISQARQTLATAVSTAELLLAAVGSPALAEFCKELSADKKFLDEASNYKSKLKIVTDAQNSLAEARSEVDQAVQQGDSETALYMHGIAMTRASYVHQLAEHVAAYDRAKTAFQPKFDAALKANGQIPGVADAQQQMNRELLAAHTQSQTDPKAALSALQQAVRSAQLILGVADLQKKQEKRYSEAKETLDQVKKSYLPGGMSDQLGGEQGLKDGQQFDAVLAAMKAAEGQRTEPNFTQLEQAAGAWLATFNTMTPEQQADKKIQRRKQICESALKQAKHLKMAARLDQMGPPPWDPQTEDEAADLHVKMLLETGDVPLEGEKGGVTGASWIKSMDFEEGKAKRNFIFKRGDVDGEPIIGFPPGGEAPREVLADEVGRQLAAATGLDFHMPETRLVGIDSSKIPGAEPGKEVVGSAQAAAPTVGSVFECFYDKPEMLKKVPPKEVQKMAVFDMVALNMDRHQDNFLITPPGEDGACSMVPIDNGLALPTRDGMEARRGKYSSGRALDWMPQSYEPFDPEILAAIDAMDPEAIVGGLTARLDVLDKEHPDLKVKEKVPEESLNLVRRSVAFTKKAAKELSPVFLQDALMTYAGEIFDTPDSEFDKVADEVIAKAKKAMGAYAIFTKMNWAEKAQYHLPTYELGWNTGLDSPTWKNNAFAWDGWARREPERAIALHDRKLPNKAFEQDCQTLEARLLKLDPNSKEPAELAKLSLRERRDKLKASVEKLERDDHKAKLFARLEQLFPGTQIPALDDYQAADTLARKVERYLGWDGDKLTEIGGVPTKKMTFEQAYSALWESFGKSNTQTLLNALLRSREYWELNETHRKVFGDDIKVKTLRDPKELQDRLKGFAEFQKLGGLKAFTDAGFDWETIDKTFKTAAHRLREAQRARQFDIDEA